MATIETLVAQGFLFKVEVELDRGVQPERLLFATPRFVKWLDETLPTLASGWKLDETPLLQMDALLADFVGGKPLAIGTTVKILRPVGDGVWELKTADIRVFGWFVRRDCFVAVSANTAEQVKTHRLYGGYRDEVVSFRNRLSLDEPKYVTGDDPNAVLSIYD